MLFQRKFDRAMTHLKETRGNRETVLDQENLADKLEKGDMPAMVISALVVIIPISLVVIAILALCGYFFIVR